MGQDDRQSRNLRALNETQSRIRSAPEIRRPGRQIWPILDQFHRVHTIGYIIMFETSDEIKETVAS